MKGQRFYSLPLQTVLVFDSSMCLLGLDVCTPEDTKLKDKLLRLKLEALVRSGGEKAADEAIETFSQVMG